MKLLVCSIYDHAVGSYQMPYYARAKGEAIRIFTDAVSEKTSPFNKHPQDYSLSAIGIFDDQTGEFENSYQKLITANECLSLHLDPPFDTE